MEYIMAGESLRSAAAVDKLLFINDWTIPAGDHDQLARWACGELAASRGS